MTSLQRAAAYLKKMGPKAALAIVPLAAVTAPANAGVVFNIATPSSTTTAASGGYFVSTPSESQSAVPLSGSLIQGVSLSGSTTFSYISGGNYFLLKKVTGNELGTTIPFPSSSVNGFWSFSFSNTASHTGSYLVYSTINGDTTTLYSGALPGTGLFVSAGAVPIPVPIGDTLDSWTFGVQVSFDGNIGSNGDVTFQLNSAGIAAEDAAAVPEPGTWMLAGSVLSGFVLYRRKRKV